MVAQRWSLGGLFDRFTTLKKGDKGPAVERLQNELNKLGAALVPDGKFGNATKAAVSSLQRDHSLKPTGVVDSATWGAIAKGGPSSVSTAPGVGRDKAWTSMSAEERKDWETLGYTAESWKAKTAPIIVNLPYFALTDRPRAAATRLGFTQESWAANRDATAATAGKAFGDEEAAAKAKAGAGVLPAKYIGALRAKAMLAAEYGEYTSVTLANIHLLTTSEMKAKWEAIYGVGTYKPINGFAVKPDIYLSKNSIWSGTTVHESLHVQEHPDWDSFAYSPTTAFGEGATTILTERAVIAHDRVVDHHPFADRVSLVTKMNTHAGLDKMKAAYFQGKTAAYQTAVTAGLTAGTTWAQFRALVDAGTLAAAEAKLK